MKIPQALWLVVSLVLVLSVSGCSSVAPWQRGVLAKSQMALDIYPVQSTFKSHIYNSREAVTGNSSAGGGGCGCN
ncbi:MAG: DUF4266 domain-containing protein [Methylococcales bacterium]|jgi:Domain of unknown function (DUF4266)